MNVLPQHTHTQQWDTVKYFFYYYYYVLIFCSVSGSNDAGLDAGCEQVLSVYPPRLF